jgi:hypothetical protein
MASAFGIPVALHGCMRTRTDRSRTPLDSVSTRELLRLHEREFAPLDPAGKRRILAVAREHGWDRSWETDRLAA